MAAWFHRHANGAEDGLVRTRGLDGGQEEEPGLRPCPRSKFGPRVGRKAGPVVASFLLELQPRINRVVVA
jgi:hypothetical protein